MNRPLAALAIITVCFVGWLGFTWLGQPPSDQELLANYAKVQDFANGMRSVHGWAWWTPSFMQGASLAPAFATILTNLVLFLFSQMAGMWAGPKLAGLLFLAAAPFSMYLFARRLTGNSWIAFAAGVFYLTSPSLLLRLGFVEHISIVSSLAALPLIFWSVLKFLEEPSPFGAVLCGVCAGVLTLAYVKISVLTLPVLMVFAGWIWLTRTRLRLPPLPLIAVCLLSYFLLGILFNLPSLRESAFVAKFDPAQLAGWQRAFSTRSVLTWVDFRGWFSGNSTPLQTHGRDGAFVGLPVVVLFAGILLFGKKLLHLDACGSICRLFLALALFTQWLSFGPRPPLLAQIEYLKTAVNAPHPSIAISWFLLAIQAWLIFTLLPQSLPWRRWLGAFLSLVYLVIPGFLLLGWLPFYREIRAPYDFFHTVGIFCVCVAAGCAAFLVVSQLHRFRMAVVALLAVLALGGAWVSTRDFRESRLTAATLSDFQAAQDFLAKSERSGRVIAFSGRYFYLLTPLLSQRALASEAFNSFYMLKNARLLQGIGLSARKSIQPYLDASGTAFFLVDKKDPDNPQELQDDYRQHFSVAFENDHFLILENKTSLAPAFVARDIASSPDTSTGTLAAALDLASRQILLVQSPNPDNRALPARITVTDGHLAGKTDPAGEKFAVASLRAPRAANFNTIRIQPPPSGGWLLVPEAYHPDWTVAIDGQPAQVFVGLTALLAAQVPPGAQEVAFTFQAPWWYGACATAAALSWLGAAVFLGLIALPWRPAWKRRFLEPPPASLQPATRTADRPPVVRPIVVLPTYNEASSINRAIDAALESLASLEVLVVDDGSPDGTAAIVRARPDFEKRVHLIERSGKLGLGSAYKTGFHWALERAYDACLEMDADLSHNPADIPRLVAALDDGADVAIGSRYLNGIRVMNWPEERLLLSTFASRYVRALTKLPLSDATSGFKAIRSFALKNLDWSLFRAEGYGFQVELHFHLWKQGFILTEVPIIFTERSEGKTKMTRGIAIEAALRVLRLALSGRSGKETP